MKHASVVALALLFLSSTVDASAKPRKPARARTFTATAYCKRGETASGAHTRVGIAAADPRVIPLGSTVRITHPSVHGTYAVQDSGVKGRRIDIFMPSCRDARRFGKKRVQVQIVHLAAADSPGQQR
jgi:3D (Asp-Asp-Asp) domain-containing protein